MPTKRRPPLSAEFVRLLFDYEAETGFLRWQYQTSKPRKWNSRYAGTIAGSSVKGYVQIQISNPNPLNYYAHQIVWCHGRGYWPLHQIDHINGERSDNRISNLRLATNSENGCNKPRQRNNTSGFVGVSFDPQRKMWRARVNLHRKMHDIGFFPTAEQAATARKDAVKRIHGEFAKIS